MLKNYFLTAYRNLQRNKIFSLINIIGLSIGISASLVIYLVVSHGFSFDRSHRDGDRIYRVVTHSVTEGQDGYSSGVTAPLPDAVRKELTGLEEIAPIFIWFERKLTVPGPGKEPPAVFKNQDHMVFADENYFHLIQYQWLAGSPATSLSQPYQVVLTESNARLYFPKLNPEAVVGKTIYFGPSIAMTISGIVKDLPYHTDFTFRTFVSRASRPILAKTDPMLETDANDWNSNSSAFQLFVKLAKGISPTAMESNIAALAKKHGINNDPKNHNSTWFLLQPLSDLHFNHNYGNFSNADEQASKPTLYGLLAVAAFLLLLACINFINLTTAQSAQRAKEIGIRKTIGGSRRQLIIQFLGETFLLTLLATCLSLLLTPFLLKVFADFIPKGLHLDLVAQPGILVFGGLLIVAVSLLSGLYPALILSAYRPVLVLKGQGFIPDGQGRRIWLRKTLTISQFVIAQVFIMATLLVAKQISYVLTKDLGFKKDAIVYFNTDYADTTKDRRLVLLNQLNAIPGITMVSLSNDAPSGNTLLSTLIKYKSNKKEVTTQVEIKCADTNYLRLYHIKLLAGTTLPYSDTIRGLLVNETYAHVLGFPDPRSAVGQQISLDNTGNNKKTILGVVADFHERSLHNLIQPMAIVSLLDGEHAFNVALAPQIPGSHSWKTVLTKMQAAFASVYPEDDFNYVFQDEEIAKAYKSEQDIARLLTWATALAILISCLGLLGLVIYITNQRTKEIGIRKILGATVTQLISLLSFDFLKLIGWAFLIAVPIAWWGAHAWLDNFAYRTTLTAWIFLAGGLLMGGIALVILLLRTFQAATANPVENLRTE